MADDGFEALDQHDISMRDSAQKVEQTQDIVLMSGNEINEMRRAIQETQQTIARKQKLLETQQS